MISFFVEDSDFDFLPYVTHVSPWLEQIATEARHVIQELNYIFCSDLYLLGINRQFLQHDFFTDVITFDHAEHAAVIEGDIFISVDRVADNASQLQEDFHRELLRVMVHGLLHLLGYDDKSEASVREMRTKEEQCLALYFNPFWIK